MDWWKAAWPALGFALFVTGVTLIGVSYSVVETAQPDKHLSMINPIFCVALALLLAGIILFIAGMAEAGWLPGAQSAKARETARNTEASLRRQFYGMLQPSRETRAIEEHTKALNRYSDEMAANRIDRETQEHIKEHGPHEGR
jgi:ABC-type transport system involved in cytochrome bd biosynthesis fused ATPase/permease subunit